MDIVKFQFYREKISKFWPKIRKIEESLNLKELRKELEFLETESLSPSFWDDMEKATKTTKRCSLIKNKIKKYENLVYMMEECETLFEILKEDDLDESNDELQKSFDEVEKEIEAQEIATLLSGEYDFKNAILTLHAGAGGTEAMDWVEMLFRMYSRWAEFHDFKTKILNQVAGEEAGIKSISILVEGENVYGYLKGEAGVHRLVRVSPFDASGRRHTSFASIEVLPEIDEEIEVEINEEDVKMDVFRASGAGGQHVNKTSSAVRLTHIPTGIVASCQNERSQIQNRTIAMKLLKSKLLEIKEREHLEKIEDIKGEQKEIAWGSQVRSYIFMPYTLVKDHRTNFENGNIAAVMDGAIDGFISAYLVKNAKELFSNSGN